jgi:hypothetical protein
MSRNPAQGWWPEQRWTIPPSSVRKTPSPAPNTAGATKMPMNDMRVDGGSAGHMTDMTSTRETHPNWSDFRDRLRLNTVAGAETWGESAVCSGADAYLWDDRLDLGTEHSHEAKRDRDARHEIAARICLTCPVFKECRSAVTEQDRGVRAGTLIKATRVRRPA